MKQTGAAKSARGLAWELVLRSSSYELISALLANMSGAPCLANIRCVPVPPRSPGVQGEADASEPAREISEQDKKRLERIRELEGAGRGEFDDEARWLYFDDLAGLEPEGFRAWYGKRFGAGTV